MLKYTVTTLVDDCKPLITDILEIVVSTYREVPQASILVVAKTVSVLLSFFIGKYLGLLGILELKKNLNILDYYNVWKRRSICEHITSSGA